MTGITNTCAGAREYAYYRDIGPHPFTGVHETSFDAAISTAPHVAYFFDGSPKCDQVTGVTPGRTYHVHKVEGHGDVADFFITDDAGNERRLADFFFVPPGTETPEIETNITTERRTQ